MIKVGLIAARRPGVLLAAPASATHCRGLWRRDAEVQRMPFVDIADGRVSRLHCIFRPVAAPPQSIFATSPEVDPDDGASR